MNWLKRIGRIVAFPGAGAPRHAATPPAEPVPSPADVFLDPYAAGQAWRLQHTEAERAAAADRTARAPWTRPLIGGDR